MSNLEQFSPEAIAPFTFEDQGRHKTAMGEVMEAITLASDQGQKFSGVHLNRDFPDTDPFIVMGGFLASTIGPDNKYQAYQYAAAFPENQIFLFDVPAHGKSDGFTTDQKIEMATTQGFSKVGRAMLEAIGTKFPDAEAFTSLSGGSLGARIMLELAAHADHVGMQPQHLIGAETTGLEKRWSMGLALSFYIQEWLLQKKYKQGGGNKRLGQAFERFKAELEEDFGFNPEDFHMYSVYLRDPLAVPIFLLRSPLATNSGFAVMEEALDKYPQLRAAFVSGGLSKITRPHKIKDDFDRLINKYPNRLSWDIWPADSHNIGLPHQHPRVVAFTKFILEQEQLMIKS